MTRSFQIYLAPPGAGPEYHHSGLKSGSVPPHPLTVLRNVPRSAFILRHPVSQAQLLDPCSADNTGPPTRDPTWERGAQTLKGPSVALTAPQRGEAWPKVWLKLGAQHVRTEIGRRTTYRCVAQIPQNEIQKGQPKGVVQQWPNRSRLGRATGPKERSEYLSRRPPHIKI